MKFLSPLLPGRLVRRYKRFLAEIILDDDALDSQAGKTVLAHCPNSGAMLGIQAPGSRVYVSVAQNPNRKLKYTWEISEEEGIPVGLNTQLPNRLVAEGIAQGFFPMLTGYEQLRREVPYGENSRIDILLEHPTHPTCFVEVKNAHLKHEFEFGEAACFPDAKTTRGTKHLHELRKQTYKGKRSFMIYVVQRDDLSIFSVARHIDPEYCSALTQALEAGVEVVAVRCRISPLDICLQDFIELRF